LGVVTLPSWIVYAVALVIVLLLVLAGVLFVRLIVVDSERYEAVAERDRIRVAMQAMQEMSRTHADTITRMASVVGKNKKGR
jgi:nitric oxide reductase large subunit